MNVLKCVRGENWNGLKTQRDTFYIGFYYYLIEGQMFLGEQLIKTLESVGDVEWLHKHFIVIDNKEIAKEHYEGLLCIQESQEDKQALERMGVRSFVEQYPSSCLPYVSLENFWNICYMTNVVFHPWHEQDHFEQFETELKVSLQKYFSSNLYPDRNYTNVMNVLYAKTAN